MTSTSDHPDVTIAGPMTVSLHQIWREVNRSDRRPVANSRFGLLGGNVEGIAVRVPGLASDQCAWLTIDDGQDAGTFGLSTVSLSPNYIDGTTMDADADTCGQSFVLTTTKRAADQAIAYARTLIGTDRLSDEALHALVVRMMAEDSLAQYEETDAGRLSELVERQIPGSVERLASWVTGVHASPVDAVVWSATSWDHCLRIMRGEEE